MRAVLACLLLIATGGCSLSLLTGVDLSAKRAANWQDVAFIVRDAETGEPVPNVQINVSMYGGHYMRDWRESGTTDETGKAVLRVVQESDRSAHATFRSPTHISRYRVNLNPRDGDADVGAGLIMHPPVEVVLYSQPHVQVGLAVPDDFRGVLHYRSGGSPSLTLAYPPTFPTGKRVWLTPYSPGTVPTVNPYPQLGGTGDMVFATCAQEASGKWISYGAPDGNAEGVRFWNIGYTSEGIRAVIGTRAAAVADVHTQFAESRENVDADLSSNFVPMAGWHRVLNLPKPPEGMSPNARYPMWQLND